MVNLNGFGAYSVDFFIYCMTTTTDWQRYHAVKEDVLLKIANIVTECGADFAFPTSTVQVAGGAPANPLPMQAAGGTVMPAA